MRYLQLSLWNVRAAVVVGNTLAMEVREVFYTPAHYLGFWEHRLRHRYEDEPAEIPVGEESATPTEPAPASKPFMLPGASNSRQADFDF